MSSSATADPATPRPKTDPAGLGAGLLCYSLWGLYPLLFQATGRAGASAPEIVAWRAILTAPICAAVVLATGGAPALRELARTPRRLFALVATALLLGTNWVVYIWAVEHGQNLATSFGYYITPLINVGAGVWLFGERPNGAKLVAIGLAAVGVAVQAAAVGAAVGISLILALTFGAYGTIRKKTAVAAPIGLMVETAVLAVPASLMMASLALHGGGVFGRNPTATLWLLACGPATALPFVAFGFAARRLPLGLIGFLQFIQPSMIFLIGVAEGEPVTPLRLAAFALIWTGVLVFVAEAWRSSRRLAVASA